MTDHSSWGSTHPSAPDWWQASDDRWYPPPAPAGARTAAELGVPTPPPATPQPGAFGAASAPGVGTPSPYGYGYAGFSGPPVAVNNGTRFVCTLLEAALVLCTLVVGWLVWSLLVWKDGKTPAKQLMGLRVVNVNTGVPLTMGPMALRELVGKAVLGNVTLGITGIVSCFTVLLGQERRAVHDHLASSLVVVDQGQFPA